MTLFYTDLESTGLNPTEDEVIAITFQEIDIASGKVVGPLRILKSWDENSNEEQIIQSFTPLITSSNPFKFIMVGNNLNFDFNFLTSKINKYLNLEINSTYFHSRPHIDLKHLMVMLNGSRFKGYAKILNKENTGAVVPYWYANNQFEKIVNYIQNESIAFTKFYSRVHQLMFDDKVRGTLMNSMNRRIDEYV